MRVEIIRRLIQIQEEKLDLLWKFTQKITELFTKHINILPDVVKEDYINITKLFIDKYLALTGEGYKKNNEEKKE